MYMKYCIVQLNVMVVMAGTCMYSNRDCEYRVQSTEYRVHVASLFSTNSHYCEVYTYMYMYMYMYACRLMYHVYIIYQYKKRAKIDVHVCAVLHSYTKCILVLSRLYYNILCI